MRDDAAAAWLPWFRRHERRLAGLWLVGSALVVLGVALPPIRERVLDRVGMLVDRWEERWAERVAVGERFLQEQRYDEAVAWFERLDREHPARDVRHGRDKERELVLRLLARSYEGQGKKGRAMETWARLVAFDSLNYSNRFAYAEAAGRLLSGWALAEEARDGYASVLRIFPLHLPSLRGYIDYYMDRGEFIPVTEAYRTYLDAYFQHQVEVRLGAAGGHVPVQVDGRAHDLELAVVLPPGEAGELVLRTGGLAFRLEAAVLEPARVAGRAAPTTPIVLDTAAFEGRRLRAVPGGWLPEDTAGALALRVPPQPLGVARVQLRLRLFKPLDKDLWGQIRKSYWNLLDTQGLAQAEARTLVFPDAERADRALSDLPWAHEGLMAALRDQY
jgi:tetratricopeptide (TPR) repeat protein